jgi:ABC-2 type transport system ATP-binding protein
MNTLSLQNISRSYGRKRVLVDVTTDFSTGLTLLTGPSGAGKSTLLRILATAERPSSGEILWDGTSVRRNPRVLRSTLGYAPQAVDLPEDLTAREFALQMAAYKGLALNAADRQFAAICDAIDLVADIDNRISTFSGGMRRRLIFAQALLGAPRLLALDEPTSELDSDTAQRVIALIRERAREAVVVMTTHLADALHADATVLRIEAGAVTPAPGQAA